MYGSIGLHLVFSQSMHWYDWLDDELLPSLFNLGLVEMFC